MEQEKTDKIIISVQPYKEIVFYQPDKYPFFNGVSIQDYKRHLEWNEFDFKKEVFEELLGEDFGKKDFYYEPKTWEFIVDAVENKIREVLKTIKKVPQQYQHSPMEYLKAYKNEHFDPINNRLIFYEDVENFLGEFYHHNVRKNIKDSNLYYFQMFYNNLKKMYDEEYPLYIAVATVDDQMKYSLIDRL